MSDTDAPPPSRSDERDPTSSRGADGEPITTGRERLRAGRLLVRREAMDRQVPERAGTADERLLRRSRTAFLDSDPWRTLRIQAEFVEGFDALAGIGPAVTVFGSARAAEGDPVYEQARELGRLLAEAGLAVITGGGPGVMAAANRGCFEAGGFSVGCNIELPHEQWLNLIQTGKIKHFPVFLVGSAYWAGLLAWLRQTLLASRTITEEDLTLFVVTDDLAEVVDGLRRFVEARGGASPTEEA